MAPDRVNSGDPALSQGAGRWRDLGRRALTACVLAPVVLFCLWQGGLAWEMLIVAATLGLGFEWSQLCRATGRRAMALLTVLGVIGLLGVDGRWLAAIAAIPAGAIVVWLLTGRERRQGLGAPYGYVSTGPKWSVETWGGREGRQSFSLPAGVFYIGPSVVALLWLRAEPNGLADMLLVLLIVWASDISAYLIGRWIGGAKLAPRISPGKTWSGAIGGLSGAAIVAAGMALWYGPAIGANSSVQSFFLLCLLLSVVSQAGDLMESAIKRRFGVKDSGWLVPGHGGLFDRLDGILVAVPAAAALVLVLGRGVVVFG